MTEENQTQNEQKNTVATVGMWFSIIWLILTVTVFFSWFWIPLLILWFILWIIGLFYKPRGKARVAVCIPLVVCIVIASVVCYIWSSVKTPANEFVDWVKPQLEQLESEDFDEDRFQNILQSELNNVVNEKTEDGWEASFEVSTGSNSLEKASYLFFSVIQYWFENALEKYNNGEIAEVEEDINGIVDVDIDVEYDEDDSEIDEEEDVTIEQPKAQSNETFSQAEKNDIEDILDILE